MLKKLLFTACLILTALPVWAIDPVAQAEMTPPPAEEPLTLSQLQPLTNSSKLILTPQNMPNDKAQKDAAPTPNNEPPKN